MIKGGLAAIPGHRDAPPAGSIYLSPGGVEQRGTTGGAEGPTILKAELPGW